MNTAANRMSGIIFSLLLTLAVLPARIREGQTSDMVNLVGSEIVIFLMCFTIWCITSFIFKKDGRLLFKAGLALVSSAMLSIVFYYGANPWFEDFPVTPLHIYSFPQAARRLAFRGILVCALMAPTIYFLDRQKRIQEALLAVERSKRIQLVQELRLLREQMNPHFLFNSLNTIKSLSGESQVKDLIVQFSNVYRHILDDKLQHDLISLEDEMEIVHSYLQLMRAGAAGNFEVSESVAAVDGLRIPPLAVQTVVENIFKHNRMSAAAPLRIAISLEAGAIVVRNNLQPKSAATVPGIGLQNLESRYGLLMNRKPTIEKTSGHFAIRLPLASGTTALT